LEAIEFFKSNEYYEFLEIDGEQDIDGIQNDIVKQVFI
jgi:hypothetical protein